MNQHLQKASWGPGVVAVRALGFTSEVCGEILSTDTLPGSHGRGQKAGTGTNEESGPGFGLEDGHALTSWISLHP